MPEDERTVYTFQKNAREEVRASLVTFKGNPYVDLRVYYKGDDGNYHPGMVSLELLEKAVRKLREEAGGQG